jgi:hypothetical protein
MAPSACSSFCRSADAATVERTCRELVAILGAGGGYIAAPAHAIQMGTPVDNVLAMLKGVLGPAGYEAAWEQSALPVAKHVP